MEVVAIVLPFLLIGIGVLFVAFSGGPSAAREVYLTRGNTAFRIAVPVIYVVGGLAVPALILANRGAAAGATDVLASEPLSKQEEEGKTLFAERCASCHNLDAANARGVQGPDLDEVGKMSEKRVLTAIRIGGTGEKQMPAGIYTGNDAAAVATYVTKVAGK
ncbi:MAG TPA: cytochrome c [Thermoleophilaceae bacterium]|nr:cytochrome c [Thermoleophilaceae bacterium]